MPHLPGVGCVCECECECVSVSVCLCVCVCVFMCVLSLMTSSKLIRVIADCTCPSCQVYIYTDPYIDTQINAYIALRLLSFSIPPPPP